MLLIAAVLGAGLLAGWVRGGRLRRLADTRIRYWPTIPLALALQVAPIPEIGTARPELVPVAVLLFSYVVLIAVAIANWRLRWFPLILAGLLLNFLAIGVNEGMPVSRDAIERAGIAETIPDLEEDGKHHLQDRFDVLVPITDVIPIPGPFATVVSIGDVVMYAGAGLFLASSMTRKRHGRHEHRIEIDVPAGRGRSRGR
ncbi:MAG: DUF5317 domain-containing protein [Actinomycetota bacterium]